MAAVALAAEGGGAAVLGAPVMAAPKYRGVGTTIATIIRQEGPK